MHGLRHLVTGLSLYCLCTAVQADIRILFRFTDAGVAVHRVMTVSSSLDFEAQLREQMPASITMSDRIRVRWMDAEGGLLATTLDVDPRVLQAPDHANSARLSRLGARQGGWVSTGPDGTQSVEVFLPERPDLALPAETWFLLLNGEN